MHEVGIVVIDAWKPLCGRRCVRYYMNFERAMALMKDVLLERGHAMNSQDAPGAFLNLNSAKDTPSPLDIPMMTRV